ncbi:MAG: sigma-70 family RNA polymerase sigma factor [Verrucomicrobia bacterium]|nr:sigma-70 family RNA polymerase sigma factor [Verrucomicrobiota bacterium]
MSDPSSTEPPPERQAEFVAALTASYGKLHGYLMGILGRRHDAEDVLQRASVRMWQKFGDFAPGTNFVAWASTFCFYEAKNFLRLTARSPLRFDDDLLATLAGERLEDLPLRERRLDALEACFAKLEPPDQTLIRAAYLDDDAINTVATRMDRAPQTLYNRLYQLRRRLADCVQRQLSGGIS